MCDAVQEAHHIVRMAAEPWGAGDSVKAGIGKAARSLGLTYRRARTLWYGQPCALLAVEIDMLRTRRAFLLADRLRRLDAERALIAARLGALEATHADLVDRVERAALDRAGTVGAGAGGGVPAGAGGAADAVAGDADGREWC